jgi:hypothetical protein
MKGEMVVTGSVIVTVYIAPGERLDFAIDGVGEASVTGVRQREREGRAT